MTLKTFISKYNYCYIGILIAVNCSLISLFKLNGLILGLIVLAFCCTIQFLLNNEGHDTLSGKESSLISEDLFHSVMKIVPETLYISMFDGSVKYISDGIEKLTGYKSEEIYKTRNFLSQLVHQDDREKVMDRVQKLQGGGTAMIEYRLLKKDGTYVWVSDYLNPIKNEWDNITHYYGVLINVDERKIHNKDLQSLNNRIHQLSDMVNHHAVRDSLTNTYNKRYSLVILQNEFNRARDQNKALSCILMDIDHLGSINNKYGYFVGDRILTEVSRCLQRNIKSFDVISRFGEDEFLIILPEIENDNLAKISGLLINAVNQCPLKDEEKNVTIHFSVTAGASSVTTMTRNITDLIEQASRALYAAKSAKGGRSKIKQGVS